MTVRKWGGETIVKGGLTGLLDPVVAALASGGYVVAWESGGSIFIQRFDAAGQKVDAEIVLGSTAISGPSIAGLADGGLAVAKGRVFNGNDIDAFVFGPSPASNSLVDAGDQDQVALAPNGSSYVFAYHDAVPNSGDIIASPAGVAGGFSPGTVNQTTAGTQVKPDVAQLAGGGYVVVWLDTTAGQVEARVFNSAGTGLSADIPVGASSNADAKVIGLSNGGFVVAWDTNTSFLYPETSGYGIHARIFDSAGNPVTSEFVVNATAAGNQFYPDLAALPGGQFLVTWEGPGPGSANSDVFGQVFNSRGGEVGTEFIVNTTSSGNQQRSDIATLSDGRVIAVWESGSSVRSQILDPRDGVVFGTDGVNVLYGNDALNDEINALGSPDTLYGLDGNDILYGGDGADVLNGNEGDDRFYGGFNAGPNTDIYNGGLGDDWFFVEDAGDVVNEAIGEGTLDRVFAAASYTLTAGAEIEIFSTGDHAGTAAINLTGNALVDNIFGNAGPNTLDGKGGADTMTGWGGDDFYYVDNAGDVVVEAAGPGNDRVLASVSYTLGTGQQIEKLTTTDNVGTNPLALTGNELANTIFGNAGSNTLNGKGGVDTMLGFGGDDFYYVDNAGDVISEGAGEGTGDRVFASASYTLGAGVQIEKLTTDNNAATAALMLIGNEFGNAIFGNAGNNSLRGMAGNDSITGLGGSDAFVFNTALNSATNVDTITDFASDDDFLLVSSIFSAIGGGTLSASAFLIGATATTAAHRIIYNAGAVLYDSDGLGGAAAVQFATLSGAPAITNADFIVV